MAEGLLARRQGVGVAGDEADALVAELDEVLGGDAPGRALVDADRRDVEILGAAVHEDEPRAALEELRVVRVLPRTSVISAEMNTIPSTPRSRSMRT